MQREETARPEKPQPWVGWLWGCWAGENNKPALLCISKRHTDWNILVPRMATEWQWDGWLATMFHAKATSFMNWKKKKYSLRISPVVHVLFSVSAREPPSRCLHIDEAPLCTLQSELGRAGSVGTSQQVELAALRSHVSQFSNFSKINKVHKNTDTPTTLNTLNIGNQIQLPISKAGKLCNTHTIIVGHAAWKKMSSYKW